MNNFRNTFLHMMVMYACSIVYGQLVEDRACLLKTDEELDKAINESPRPCRPGFIYKDNVCKSCPPGTTMPHWNTCRTAINCPENPCSGEYEEVEQHCTASKVGTCRRIMLSTPAPNGTTTNCTLVETGESPSDRGTCEIGITLGAVLLVVVVAAICYNRRKLKRCGSRRQEGYQQARRGRSNTVRAAGNAIKEYPLRGNPAGTAVLIVNKDRGDIDPDIELSEEISKFLLGSATVCKIVIASSKQEVEAKIKSILSGPNLGDCFACILLGHGDLDGKADGLICQDSSYLLLDVLKSWFHGSCCKNLVGKPKLFFHACCRGGETELVQGAGGGGAGPDTTTDTADILTCFASAHGNIKDENGAVIFKGKKAYFDSKGSLFLRILKQVIKTWGHREDLVSILTEVNQIVGQHEVMTERTTGKLVKQQPIYQSTLHGKFYLKGFFPDEENAAQAVESVEGPSQSPEPLGNGHATVHHENEAPSMADHNQSSELSAEGHAVRNVNEEQDGTVENNSGTEEDDGGNNEGDDDNDNTDTAHMALLHIGASPDSPLS